MASKHNRRTRITRSLLKKSLMGLMQEKPFSQITIKELCDRANLNRTTFYLHYSNIDMLLSEIEEETGRQTMEHIRGIQSTEGEFKRIVAFLDYVRDHAEIFRTILLYNPNNFFKERMLRAIIAEIKSTMKKYGTSAENKYIQSFILSGCHGIIISWILDDFDLSTPAIADLLYHLCEGSERAGGAGSA